MVTALSVLKGTFFQHLGTYRALVATGGSVAKFTVASLADLEPNKYAGWQMHVDDGPAADDLRVLEAGPNALGELEPKRIFSSTGPVAGNKGQLWGNSIDGGDELTSLFNDRLSVARPYVPTKLTIVTDQSIYDLTAYVQDVDDVRRVSIRCLDSASVEPYKDHFIRGWHRPFVDINASTGAREIKFDLGRTLTAVTPAVRELYIHSYKTLTAFNTDASTVEAAYADWLAWEAVLRHAVDQMATSQADKTMWGQLSIRAQRQVDVARLQFAPYVPLYISPFEAGR